jgi:hypothetical protein
MALECLDMSGTAGDLLDLSGLLVLFFAERLVHLFGVLAHLGAHFCRHFV